VSEVIERHVELFHEVDGAVLPERRNRRAGPRIERHEKETGRDHENPLVLPVRPVTHAASGIPPRSKPVAVALVHARPQPQLPPARRIDCRHGALATHGRVEDAVHHDGSRFVLVDRERRIAVPLRGAAERRQRRPDRGFPAPGDLEVLEIVSVDLVERRVARALRIVVEITPFAGLGGDR
jgi:hypothetical protein